MSQEKEFHTGGFVKQPALGEGEVPCILSRGQYRVLQPGEQVIPWGKDDPGPITVRIVNFDTLPRLGFRRVNMLGGLAIDPNGVFAKPLQGQVWVLTGQIPGITRDDARKLLMSYGATVGGAVTDFTFAVVAGQGAGRKLTRAKELDVRVIPADQFITITKLFQHGEFPA